MTSLTYAAAGDFLERFVQARSSFDGDAFVALFTDDAEVLADPFAPGLVGHNAIRADLLERSTVEERVEFVVERHWVVGPTILAAWHASYVHAGHRAVVRHIGFATFEVADDGRVRRARYWYNRAETPAAG